MSWQRRLRRFASALRRGRSAPAAGYVYLAFARPGLQARIVDSFDAHEAERRCWEAVVAALEVSGTDFVMLPRRTGAPRRVVVSEENRSAALSALAQNLNGAEWMVDRLGEDRSRHDGRSVTDRHLRSAAHGDGIRLYRLLGSASGTLLGAGELACELEFWPVIGAGYPRPDGGRHLAGTRVAPTRNGVVAYLTPDSWRAATAAAEHWPARARARSVFDVAAPIDLVYTWVDGDDPVWLARKNEYVAAAAVNELNESADHNSRFTSRDELRYSLRSAAMYASWARRIYIVTDGQVPPWLDLTHPKIRVIDHKEIFSDPSVLPVFNSHAIESQLHHIDGLSEQYLYLNDDFFFGRMVAPELFFHANGIAKFFLSPATLDIDPPSPRDLPVMSAAKRNRDLIMDEFGVSIANKLKHTPQPQLRSVVEAMERQHPDIFARVASSRFRHPADLSIPSALHHYYAYALGRAVPGIIEYTYQDINRPGLQRQLSNLARRRDADVFCLNDNHTTPEQLAGLSNLLTEFFEQSFAVPSPFELPPEQVRAPHRSDAERRSSCADYADDRFAGDQYAAGNRATGGPATGNRHTEHSVRDRRSHTGVH